MFGSGNKTKTFTNTYRLVLLFFFFLFFFYFSFLSKLQTFLTTQHVVKTIKLSKMRQKWNINKRNAPALCAEFVESQRWLSDVLAADTALASGHYRPPYKTTKHTWPVCTYKPYIPNPQPPEISGISKSIWANSTNVTQCHKAHAFERSPSPGLDL